MDPEQWISDGPAEGPVLVLAHGAGAAMDTPFMNTVARGLGERGIRVVRFEFPYMSRRRREGGRSGPGRAERLKGYFCEVVRAVGTPADLAVGGKSMGGRVASMIADEVGARALVCLGYPFHSPGNPGSTRTAHLEALRTPALIVQGTRDPFGSVAEIGDYRLSPAIRIVFLPDGDHSFRPRTSSGRTLAQNLAQAVDATASFLREL